MKNYKVFMGAFMCSLSVLFTSCESENFEIADENPQGISKEVIAKIKELAFNPANVEKKTFIDFDGSKQTMYVIEGDIMMSENQLMHMSLHGGIQSKQYHTNNLVNTPITVRVVGFNPNNRFALSGTAQTALRYAVDNYNALNTDIQLQYVQTSNFTSADIVAFADTNGDQIPRDGIRGVAGFPSGGQPFKRIRINEGANSTGDDQALEHLFTHELGHCFGLRHTDWDTRNSCSEPGIEPVEPIGAIQIPGTPGASQDPDSVMNACFSIPTDGEFGDFDRVALEFLY